MNKKILTVVLIALVGVFAFETANISAAYTDFSIKANSSYGAKSTKNLKADKNYTAYVNWKSSNKESHKEWFQVVNNESAVRSDSVLFSFLGKGYINEYSSVKYNYYYYLRARREHIINPSTTVKGNWES